MPDIVASATSLVASATSAIASAPRDYYTVLLLFALALILRFYQHRTANVSKLHDLADFILHEVLIESEQCTILLGRFEWQPEGESALIKLWPRPTKLAAGLVRSLNTAISSYSGAEYAYYNGRSALSSLIASPALRPNFSLEVIAPASAKQVARSRPQAGVLVAETPAMYHAVTAPYIESLDPRSVAWIGNVLNLSKEKERVLYNEAEDEEVGFLLNVDTKWKSHPDCATTERSTWHGHAAVKDLYCLAICHRRDVRSLRDLTAEHLPMLKSILAKGPEVIEAVYGIQREELRIFVHYQPQFYHFHVHFTRLHNDLGCQVERAHLLADIIATLEADGEAYQTKRTLHYQLKANDALLAKVRAYEEEEEQAKKAKAKPSAKKGGASSTAAKQRRPSKSPARR